MTKRSVPRVRDNEQELQDSASWDWEKAERRPAKADGGAVVSVTFSGPDFDTVALAAERAGMKLSRYICVAALETARKENQARVSADTSLSTDPE